MKHLAPSDVIGQQWIFNRVVEHYRKRPVRSVRADGKPGCAYRNGEDRCFAGALIDDDHYDVLMEGYRVCDLVQSFSLPDWFMVHSPFIEELQTLHDTKENWRKGRMPIALSTFAAQHGLALETV